jgi:hypothetical protein
MTILPRRRPTGADKHRVRVEQEAQRGERSVAGLGLGTGFQSVVARDAAIAETSR